MTHKDNPIIHPHYYYSDEENTFKIDIVNSNDSFFISYYFVFKKGKHLNAGDNENDYAAVFALDDLINNKVSLQLKDYRMQTFPNDSVFIATLTFLKNSTLLWDIDSSFSGYFPNQVVFKPHKFSIFK